MLNNKLIKSCTCGNDSNFSESIKSDLDIMTCDVCGVIHQKLENWTNERYYDFYRLDYHVLYQKKRGATNYEDRYQHDCKVAQLRIEQYEGWLDTQGEGLDIGSSNSAFVHEARSAGFNCIGLEPGEHIGDDSVTVRGTLQSVDFEKSRFSWATMHDSIEHMIDVNSSLEKLSSIIKPDGVLLLDLPDYFDISGQHHWKRIEHLWFFTQGQMTDLLGKHGFVVKQITRPIPGKLVFYCRLTN